MAIVQTVFRQAISGRGIANVQWFEFPDVGGSAYQEFTDALAAFYTEHMTALLGSGWSFIGCNFRNFDGNAPFTVVKDVTGGPVVGEDGTSALLPRGSALLISTAASGSRPNRGRLYQGGFTEAQWDTAGWSTGAKAGALAFGTDLMDQLAPEGTEWIIARPNFTANTAIRSVVSNVSITDYSRSQRRRNLPA